MRLLYFATADIAIDTLRALARDPRFTLVGVVTKPDAPVGRHQTLTPSPIASVALELGLPVFRFASLKEPEVATTLAALSPDLSLVFAYGKIIPQHILDIPTHKSVNIHPSLLPKFRGPSPLQAALDAGEQETGITLMQLDAQMDHGPLLAQTTLPLSADETAITLHDRVQKTAASWVPDVLVSFVAGSLTPTPQDDTLATVCPMLSRESGALDWSQPATIVARRIRAYAGWPGTWTVWHADGAKKRVKIAPEDVSGVVAHKGAPGSLMLKDGVLLVSCGEDTALQLSSLQIEGKERLAITELLRGMPSFAQGQFLSAAAATASEATQ